MTRPITISVTLEAADVRRGLMRTLSRQSRGARLWPVFIAMALGVLGLGVVRLLRGQTLPTVFNVFAVVLMVALVAIPYVLSRIGDRWFAALPDPATAYRFSEEGVRVESAGKGFNVPWEGLWWEAREGLILLFPTPTAFHAIPLRELSPDEITAMRAWLENHARPAPTPRGRWVLPFAALVMGVLTAMIVRYFM